MSRIWTSLTTYEVSRGEIAAMWMLVPGLEGFTRFALLRFKASGAWTPVAGMEECGPDGLIGASWPPELLVLPDCAVGALIGRIGGSSASLKAAGVETASGDTKPFALGAYAVVRVPEKAVGPLFIGFNLMRRPVGIASLAIEIAGARG